MNICIKKYKVFIISLCLVSMFSFNFCQLRVNAVVGADDAVVVEGGILTTAAVSLAVGTLLVAGGSYIYQNVDSTDIKYIADGIVQSGEAAKAFSVKSLASGEKVLTWTKDGLDWVGNKISSMVSDGSIPVSVSTGGLNVGSFTINSSNVSPGSSYSISTVGPSFVLSPTSGAIPVSFKINGQTITNHLYNTSGATSIFTVCYFFNDYRYDCIGLYNGSKVVNFFNVGYNLDSVSVSDFNLSLPSDSVCSYPVSDGVKSYNNTDAQDVIGSTATAPDGSVSYQPKVGFPLTDSGNTTADGGTIYAPSADIPYGKTWPDVGTVSIPTDSTSNPAIPTTGDTTGTIDTGKGILDIPILGDILRILQKILDFLGTMISSLVTALINALEQLLTKLFVPTADMFNDFYSDIEDNVKSKFPYSVSILNSLKVNADEFKDIHVTMLGHDCVIVSAQFVNDNISWIRVVTSCFWIFSLFVYVWRKINAVLNGGDVNSTTVYAPGGGGSGPPSII